MALNPVGGVSCFSAIHDNLLMWGHYAQGHQGFCLEYSTDTDSLSGKRGQFNMRIRFLL